jgi:hypothetical protein
MIEQPKRLACSIVILLMSMALSGVIADAAPKAVKKKNITAKKMVADIPRERVVREFKNAYQSPPGSAIIKVYHTGKFRKGSRLRGDLRVPVQVHLIALEVRLTDCGIKMRDTWEVNFYNLETEWIFDGILQTASKQLTRPAKKHPALDEAAIKNLVSEGIMKQYEGAEVSGVTVQNKKAVWRLCTPEYRVTSKVLLNMKNIVYNTTAVYECLAVSTLSFQNGAWAHAASGCVYRGKEVPDCHIGTMCRQLEVGSTIPSITDAEALSLLRTAFENEYGLKRNNISVEHFTVLSRLPAENFGKTIPCVMRAAFVIDETREMSGGTRSTVAVRAAYECVVYGSLNYSADKKSWEGSIESCCSSESERCGRSCSTPVKGCKRLGEK